MIFSSRNALGPGVCGKVRAVKTCETVMLFFFRAGAAIFTFSASLVAAQDYPVKPIRLIAPFAPGGATDVLARIAGQKLNERLGQPVVVENRTGAGGNIGAEQVAKAAPDGYTLLLGGVPHAIAVSLYPKLGYELTKDLSAIAEVASFPSLIVLHPSLPVRNVKELIALAKSRPGQLNFGSAGNGSPNHLALELFKTQAGVSMTHIPYRGAGQVVADLLAGQLQLASMGFPIAMPHVQAGKLRAIAVTGAARSPLLPVLPTVAEAGLAGFDVSSWYGVFGPAGLSRDIVNKLNAEIGRGINAPDLKERLTALGAEPSGKSPDAFTQYVREEIAKWAKVVKVSGAKLD